MARLRQRSRARYLMGFMADPLAEALAETFSPGSVNSYNGEDLFQELTRVLEWSVCRKDGGDMSVKAMCAAREDIVKAIYDAAKIVRDHEAKQRASSIVDSSATAKAGHN